MANAFTEKETCTVYLSGFSQALNWRATEFVKRLHRVRVCNLCGVVPSEAYLLECSHVLCRACYDGVVGCGQGCPIDGTSVGEIPVTSLKFPESDLLKREVRCWNKHRGCDFSGTLADALNHFHEVCTFHEVRCVRCHKMVRQRDMVDHYARCREGESGEEEPGMITHETVILKSTKEVEAMLSRLADTQASLQDSLNNLTAETRSCLQSIEKRIDDQNTELLQVRRHQEESGQSFYETFEVIKAALTTISGLCSPVLQVSEGKAYCAVRNYTYHLERSQMTTEEQIVSEAFSIAGYTARLRIKFVKARNDTDLEIFFHLCRGPKDEELDWPFVVPFVLSLVNVEDRSRDSKRRFNPLESAVTEPFRRPTTECNRGVGGLCFIRGGALHGFAHNNVILVSVKLER